MCEILLLSSKNKRQSLFAATISIWQKKKKSSVSDFYSIMLKASEELCADLFSCLYKILPREFWIAVLILFFFF